MQTDIRGSIDSIGDILCKIRLPEIFRECKILLPQPHEQSFLDPPSQIISIKTGHPRIHLLYTEAFLKFFPCLLFEAGT